MREVFTMNIQSWANKTRFPWLNRLLNRILWGAPDESPPDFINDHLEAGESRKWT